MNDTSITIFHNPACGTSRTTLALIRQSGVEPVVVEYLKTPPGRARLMELIAAEQAASDGANQFVSLVRQFTDIQALTPEIVAAFIEKVYVHDRVVVDGKMRQEIRVVYNFIGDVSEEIAE